MLTGSADFHLQVIVVAVFYKTSISKSTTLLLVYYYHILLKPFQLWTDMALNLNFKGRNCCWLYVWCYFWIQSTDMSCVSLYSFSGVMSRWRRTWRLSTRSWRRRDVCLRRRGQTGRPCSAWSSRNSRPPGTTYTHTFNKPKHLNFFISHRLVYGGIHKSLFQWRVNSGP